MKLNELQAQIESAYHKYFPNSRIFVGYSDKLGATISIGCYLAGAKEENPGKYWDNDMFHVSLTIHGESGQQLPKGLQAESDLPEIMELSQYLSYFFKKTDNKYKYCDSEKFSFRKNSGDAEKLVKYLDKYFASMREKVLTAYIAGQILPAHLETVKIKLANFEN